MLLAIVLTCSTLAVQAQYWYTSDFYPRYQQVPQLARAGHQCVGLDAIEYGSMVCFGGLSSTNSNNATYTTLTQTLTQTTATTTANQTSTTAPTPIYQVQKVSDSWSANSTLSSNLLIKYNALSSTWSVVSTSNAPSSRAHQAMVAHSSGTYALMHGGMSYTAGQSAISRNNGAQLSTTSQALKDLWLLDFKTMQWTKVGDGPSLFMHTLVHDPLRNAFLIHGGVGSDMSTVSKNVTRVRIIVTNGVYSLQDVIQLSSMPTAVSQHSMTYYQNQVTGMQSFMIFGGVGVSPATDAGSSTNTLMVYQCPNTTVTATYTGCQWVVPNLPQLNRFAHRAIVNAVSGELIVSGGVQGTSVTAGAIKLAIISDTVSNWVWVNAPSMSINQQAATAYHTVTTVMMDADTAYQIRFGGMNYSYPTMDESQAVAYYSNVDLGFMSNTVTTQLPIAIYAPPPPLPVLQPQMYTNYTDANVTYVMPNSTLSQVVQVDFSTTQYQQQGIIAAAVVGGILVFAFLSMCVYIRRINPQFVKQYSYFKWMSGDENQGGMNNIQEVDHGERHE